MGRLRKVLGALVVTAVMAGALFAMTPAAFASTANPACLSCHGETADWTVGAVVKTDACIKCHTPGLLGSHPYHNPGANCGAVCHPGFGPSVQSATPAWRGPQGSFASADSVNVDPTVLHVIHSTPRWMGSMDRSTSACSSCHAAAACTACHEDPAPQHKVHSSVGNAKYTKSTAWTGTVCNGILGEDQLIKSALAETNYCSSVGCHNTDGVAAYQPKYRESHAHNAYPEYGYPDANVVAKTGRWTDKPGGNYTFGMVSYSNTTGSTLQIDFTGAYVELVSEKDPYRGIAKVTLDGVDVANVDLYAASTSYQQVLYRSPRLGSGTHTIKVTVTGNKNPLARANFVFVDAFRVYSSLPASIAPQCASCHADKTSGHGTSFSHEASLTAGTYASYSCTSCHSLKMIDEHKRTSSKTSAASSVCGECHTQYAPFSLTTPAYDYTCTWSPYGPGCHQATGNQEPHNFGDSNHTLDTTIASEAKCRGCHPANLDVTHNNSIATNDVTPNCLSCHGVNKFPASKSCTAGCHTATGVDAMETHPYITPSHEGDFSDTGVANTGGKTCATCHDNELYPEHRKSASTAGGQAIICSTCHDKAYLPRPWNDECIQCHMAGKAPAPHGDYANKHRYDLYAAANTTTCGGANCHDVAMADVIHNASNPGNGDCTSCHNAAGVPTKKLCTDCHTSHNFATPHQSGSYPASTECLRCHDGFADINTAHPSCATCHKNAALTDYLNDNYTAACTGCHRAGLIGGHAYTPADPQHYTGSEATHTASAAQAAALYDYDGAAAGYAGVRCDKCHKSEMKPEHITKTWSAFPGVPATYADKCVACHEVKVDTLTSGWNKTCGACHATTHTATATQHNAAATGGACGGAGCHVVTDVAALHNNSITTNGTALPDNGCLACHNANTQATKDCMSCHAGHGEGAHTANNSQECVNCHESANVQVIHPTCDTCHTNPKYPNLTSGKNAECATCHKAGLVGTHNYAPSDPNHYNGTETTHTASGANGLYSTYACSTCHLMEMKPEHQKVSASFATTTTPIGKCVVCHETKVDNIVGAWDKKCASCHAGTHTQRAAKHNATGSGCGGTGCHQDGDVAIIHNNSITTNGMTPNCLTCHDSNTSVPATIDCSTAGCHLGMVHGHALNLSASNYNNTNITGCTNSGAACHGSQATSPTPDYANRYHPDTGCQEGACHSGNSTQADPAFNNPQTCQNCHGGRSTAPLNYDKAPDTIALTTGAPAGHYGETTHTAGVASTTGTINTGGLTSAPCTLCHQPNNTTGGIDGLYNQHQVLQNLGNTTCYDCHNANVSVAAVVTGNWPTNNCADCHNATSLPAYVQHGNGGPVTGTVQHVRNPENDVDACNSAGCHTNTDLHYLHRGNGPSTPTPPNTPRQDPGCDVCHDPLMQGWKPWRTTCGSQGACHVTQPHSDLGPAHSATALSQECINCHESTDTRTVHGGASGCDKCHTYNKGGARTWANIREKRECTSCHDGVLVGTHIYKPHDPNHYVGTETTHTATAQTGTYGKITSIVAAEGFNSATWPATWTRASATAGVNTRVLTSSTSPFEGSHYVVFSDTDTTAQTDRISKVFDTSNVASPKVSFTYQAISFGAGDSASLEYSTDGVNFTPLWSTTVSQASWTTIGPLAVPRDVTLTLRFSVTVNAASNQFKVDDLRVVPGDAPASACNACHKMEMKPEHFKASSEATRVPFTYADKCVDCHENKGDYFGSGWDHTCTQCHAANVTHDSQTAKHNASAVPGASTCGGSGCHFIADVAVIHNNSSTANATVTNCTNTCHKNDTTVPAGLDCGQSGCHAGMSAHSHELDLSGSDFNSITVTGCTNSGTGCHGNSPSTNYTDYHPNSGCTTGACHTAANHNSDNFMDPNTCMNCHGGGAELYAGATDRVPVAGASPDGHYPEALHTAANASRTASLTAGGTISARCNQCHNDVNATAIDGLYNQHQGLAGALGNTSCADCHNYNTDVTTQITSDWTTDTCGDCHNATAMPTYVQHSIITAPAVTATQMGTCQTVGCHTTLDLHALHKGSASSSASMKAAGCALTGCHDYTKQGLKPTKKSCGVGGTCHTTTPTHPNETAAHQATNAVSVTCFKCHEGSSGATTDVRNVVYSQGFGGGSAHASCTTCHNGAANLGSANTANCTDCHNNDGADTSKIGKRNYTPYDPAHDYVTSHDASLTASATFGTTTQGSTLTDYHGAVVSYERACLTCHKQQTGGTGIDLVFEHKKTSSDMSSLAPNDVCVGCHEVRGDNLTTRWNGSCAGEGSLCHNMAALHTDWGTKHNASTQQIASPGTGFVTGSNAQVFTEDFGTTTTWPAAWTRSSTNNTYIGTQTGSARSGAAAQFGVNTTRTTYNFYKTAAINLSGYSSANLSFWYQVNGSGTTDYITCEYSTTSATTGYTELFRVNTDALTWTQSPTLTLPGGGNVWIRFQGTFNLAGEYGRIDDVVVNAASPANPGSALPANSTAAVSCGNPTGNVNPQSECHDVSDVADIHSSIAGRTDKGCPICHTDTNTVPTALNCQAAQCHSATGVGLANNTTHNTNFHESAISNTTVFGTNFSADWCRGCHDDSIDNEHFVLGAYGSQPCSMCHKKTTNSAAPTNVTAANTSAAIHGDATPGNELCTDCHTNVTKTAPHVQREGDGGTPGTQFADNWSGHKIYDSMYGSRTGGTGSTFNGQATTITWSLPTLTSWLKAGWQSGTQVVRCNDCHGAITGATGPHGGSVDIKLATGYDNSYTTGALYLNGTSMSNTTNICAKCHTTTGLGYNGVHSRGDHQGNPDGKCINCHTPTPHAWKRPRLIGYMADPAPYRVTEITGITQRSYTPTGWSKDYCGVGGSCGSHGSAPTGTKWP